MAVKTYKPTTPSRRTASTMDFSVLTKIKPLKQHLKSRKRISGRSNAGRLTVRRRGGGHKRKLRLVDFKRDKFGIEGVITAIEYDPNRTANIARIHYPDGDKRYILASRKLKVGFRILSDDKTPIQPGNRMKIKNIPEGIDIYNIELQIGRGGQIVRSAGLSAKLVSLESKYAQIRLPSGQLRLVNKECRATMGIVGNEDHQNIVIGKAGRKRWMGVRPHVLGKAMNPCDHPHGGGEGGCPIGLKHPKTKWGKNAYGVKTRRRKYSNKFVVIPKRVHGRRGKKKRR